jgi:hypothetical protein
MRWVRIDVALPFATLTCEPILHDIHHTNSKKQLCRDLPKNAAMLPRKSAIPRSCRHSRLPSMRPAPESRRAAQVHWVRHLGSIHMNRRLLQSRKDPHVSGGGGGHGWGGLPHSSRGSLPKDFLGTLLQNPAEVKSVTRELPPVFRRNSYLEVLAILSAGHRLRARAFEEALLSKALRTRAKRKEKPSPPSVRYNILPQRVRGVAPEACLRPQQSEATQG